MRRYHSSYLSMWGGRIWPVPEDVSLPPEAFASFPSLPGRGCTMISPHRGRFPGQAWAAGLAALLALRQAAPGGLGKRPESGGSCPTGRSHPAEVLWELAMSFVQTLQLALSGLKHCLVG